MQHCRYTTNTATTYCNKLNIGGYSPFHLACSHGHKEVFKLLSEDSEFNQQV